jgi:hypothetical protein
LAIRTLSFGYLSIEAVSKLRKIPADPSLFIPEQINDGYKIGLVPYRKENFYEQESHGQTVGDIGF